MVKPEKTAPNEAIIKEIFEVLDGLDYGAVEIKVHNSKITQIEVTRKKRFEDIWNTGEGGGI